MCGIVGYIGWQEASPLLLKGLKRLEYRGYDSAGLALLDGNILTVMKQKGSVSGLEADTAALRASMKGATAGIGHTRWATHGGAKRLQCSSSYECCRRYRDHS